MANTATYYCCKSFRRSTGDCINPNGGSCSGNTYVVNILSATSASNFGVWTDALILSKICVFSSNCSFTSPCIDSYGVDFTVDGGCYPASLYPITINFEVKENGIQILTGSREINSGNSIIADCTDGTGCDPICNTT